MQRRPRCWRRAELIWVSYRRCTPVKAGQNTRSAGAMGRVAERDTPVVIDNGVA